MNETVVDILEEMRNYVILKGRDRIYNVILKDTSDAGLLLFSELKRSFNNFNFIYDESIDTLPEFSISQVTIKTDYPEIKQSNILGEKEVSRTVNTKLDFSFYDPVIKLLDDRQFNSSRSEPFRLVDLEIVQNRSYTFGYAKLPQENFFSSILLPVGIILVSAATVILFFVIRSK